VVASTATTDDVDAYVVDDVVIAVVAWESSVVDAA